MVNSTGDTAEIAVAAPRSIAPQPGSIDPGALRRAMKFGQRVRSQFGARLFRDVENELRMMWLRRGEATDWEWVRAAVRAGFEPESIDDE